MFLSHDLVDIGFFSCLGWPMLPKMVHGQPKSFTAIGPKIDDLMGFIKGFSEIMALVDQVTIFCPHRIRDSVHVIYVIKITCLFAQFFTAHSVSIGGRHNFLCDCHEHPPLLTMFLSYLKLLQNTNENLPFVK